MEMPFTHPNRFSESWVCRSVTTSVAMLHPAFGRHPRMLAEINSNRFYDDTSPPWGP